MRTTEQIISHYSELINEAKTDFEIKLLQAEMDHKIKLFNQGISATDIESNRNGSQFECIGCGS